ncbi:hypothetical protein F6X40_17115 [Paraburkholderia sp. UCT31]|uniref:hypothetical protein n=1 Tax=Paraburkholderia sp. UCT31 TaxID=2615209 RepID=UPI001656394A|nr:hypothetical protein [Paraburkholderia sp. UCT31]MBC8738496.1 hypothetical protein [Paraburkholderia sp. UCT31]
MSNVPHVLPTVNDHRVRVYVLTVLKPALVIAVIYCVLSSMAFQSSFDGSFLMYRAAQLGLVNSTYAAQHETDVVLFKQVGPATFEYRVRQPIFGYAGIPWLVVHRTTIDLDRLCDAPGATGCELARE